MEKKFTHDFLVIGAGIVGQMLARSLVQRKQRVCIAHDPALPGSSSVAAWMINPVTGIRFVPSWRVETFLPSAIKTYHEIKRENNSAIWHPLSIVRMFQGEDEWPRWQKKRLRPDVRHYVSEEFSNEPKVNGVRHDSGGVVFHSGGWANLTPWLHSQLKNPPAGMEILTGTPSRSDLENSRLEFQGRSFERVISCTGYSPLKLSWKPAKGELLTVRIPGLSLDQILLRGIFVIPLGNEYYRAGATYEWDDITSDVTEKGVRFISEKLSALVTLPFELIDAQCGIRPILQDARPVVGLDPLDPRFGICNGFGSKAALMAPWVCDHFAEHLVSDTPLDRDINLSRL